MTATAYRRWWPVRWPNCWPDATAPRLRVGADEAWQQNPECDGESPPTGAQAQPPPPTEPSPPRAGVLPVPAFGARPSPVVALMV